MYNMVYKKMYLVSHHNRSVVNRHTETNRHGQKRLYIWMSGFIRISSVFKNVKEKERKTSANFYRNNKPKLDQNFPNHFVWHWSEIRKRSYTIFFSLDDSR